MTTTTDQVPTIAEGTRLEGIRRKVFMDRYALKGEDGTPLEEYPEQMWRRVAAGIAAVEPTVEQQAEWTQKFYELLRDFKFVPGGRILSGAGTGHHVTFYNCFVVGLGEDPLDPHAPRTPRLDPAAARPAFFSALAQMTDIMSRSGGVGMNLSALPPQGTPITTDGRGRHGAVRPRVALSLGHPDVERLIDEKDGPNLAHVDVAVIVTPEFDRALEDDADWTPYWGDIRGATVRARALWERVRDGHGRRVGILRPDAAMLTIDDSREAIVAGAAEAAMALYHGEALVVDFSLLRPKGAYIKTVNGTSSGPVAWMYLYDAVARGDDGAAPTEKGVIWFGEIASVITGKTIQQGGCFGPDQRIATSRGLLRAAELADLIDAGEKVNALTHEGPRPITWAFRNGTKPLLRVTTARGFTVDVTAAHKMGILRGGKLATAPLEELEVGDEVLLFLGEKVAAEYVPLQSPAYERSIMSVRLNETVRLPEVLDEKLAYFLGYLHGDGYVHWGRKLTWQAPKAIKLATDDAYPAIRNQLVAYARDLFGVEPIVEDRPGEACKSVALYPRVLINWLQHNGLLKARSEAVRVPEKIFRSPSSVMGAFVAGYFDADGSDRGRKGGYGFDSVSLDMLRDIQQLLAANGILSHIHTTDRSAQGWRTIHRLVVTGAEFKACMNLFMNMALKNRARAGFRNHRNGYPRDVWPELGVAGRYYQGLWDSTKPQISYRALSRVQDRLVIKGEVTLAERVQQLLHTVPDHIVSIEPLGESEVYDFEVDDVHMLSGNGFYTSNSRRGALMLMLDDDHPDIEEFIAAKRIGPDGRPVMIEHANMSLCISDAFMAAVKADLPWDLKWQGQTVRTVRARDIWDQICTAAWTTAEPGVVFMERYQNRSNTYYFENIRCVNPCVTGDTLIYTAAGLYPAAELAELGAPVTVASPGDSGVTFKRASHVFPTGVKPVYRLQTKEGYTVRLTAEHKVLTTTGWKEAQALVRGDRIRLLKGEGGFGIHGSEEMGRVLGWLVGDGCINTNRGKGQPSVVLSFWGQDRALAPAFAETVNWLVAAPEGVRQYHVGVTDIAGRDESRVTSVRLVRMIDPELLHHKLQVPPSVLRGTREMQRGFLQALISSDGSVQGSQAKGVSVRLSSSDPALLEAVQRLLLNLGIASSIYANRRQETRRLMPDGKGGHKTYASKAQHELVIACANLPVFAEKVGFLQAQKQDKLIAALGTYKRACNRESFVATFQSLTPDGEEMVYDLTEPEAHLFVGGGLALHNCGEQGLPPGGVCNLGALNLACYVDAEGRLLEDDLARDTAHAIRFLDDVIDATPYFSELHVKMQREGTRRTGLGTMGLADALIKMGVAYGSEQSLEAIDRIYSIIRDAAYRQSVALAREKGPFGRFDREEYHKGWFIKRLPQDIQDGIREHGIRNGVLLTQAPTGTTSLLAGVSSGIEPVYDFAMKRVDRTGEHILYHPLYQAWREAHPNEEKPAYFVGAKDLTPDEHVVVQARVQQYTDSSISKCVSGDTLVTSERGLLPIADLYAGEAPDTFRSLPLRVASLGEAGTQTASHFYYGGRQLTLAVRLADGHTITGTPNHRLYAGTPRGLEWKRLDELGAGDCVALKIGSQVFGADASLRGFEQSTTRAGYQKTIRVPASMNPALAHFVGAWCAEGTINHYTVRITNNERPVLARLNEEVRLLFGIEGTIAPQGRGKALTLSINSKSMCELLRFLGCRHGAAHKVVPWAILQSSRESVVAFLSGLYLNGFVTPAKIAICLASRTLIEQLQLILDNLGVQSWITAKRNTMYDRDYYELNAHGQEAQKLARLLLFDEAHKNARAQTLLQRSFGPSKSDVIPLEARESVFAGATRTVRYRHHAYSQALSGLAEGRMLSWGGLRHLANDPDVPLTPALRTVVDDNLHFRRVVAVEDAGAHDVYDLTVPSAQAFVANGIVNHNTANAPHDHTIEDVKQLYTLAYDLGCKGVTYYRDGSRDAVLTSVAEAPKASRSADDGTVAPAVAPAAPQVDVAVTAPPLPAPVVARPAMPAWMLEGHLKRRPGEMGGFTRNVAAPEGKVNITINSDEDGPLEVFINVGRAGSDVAALAEALGRLISLQLRLPSTMSQEERLRQVANQLRGIGGSRSIGFGKDRVHSLPDAVAQAILRHLEEHPTPPSQASAVPAAQLALPVSDTPTTPTASRATTAAAPGSATVRDGSARAEPAPATAAVLTGNLCPGCGSSGSYVYEEGCRTCHNCGYSEC